jgi:hypothetical protein
VGWLDIDTNHTPESTVQTDDDGLASAFRHAVALFTLIDNPVFNQSGNYIGDRGTIEIQFPGDIHPADSPGSPDQLRYKRGIRIFLIDVVVDSHKSSIVLGWWKPDQRRRKGLFILCTNHTTIETSRCQRKNIEFSSIPAYGTIPWERG